MNQVLKLTGVGGDEKLPKKIMILNPSNVTVFVGDIEKDSALKDNNDEPLRTKTRVTFVVFPGQNQPLFVEETQDAIEQQLKRL